MEEKKGTFICVLSLFRKLGVNPNPENRLTFLHNKTRDFCVFPNHYQNHLHHPHSCGVRDSV